MDYINRFGLEFNPFIKNVKHESIIETNDYNEAIYRLNTLLKTKGFGLITGNAGKGKTTIVRNWANSLNTSLYKVIYISLSTLTVSEFYKHLAEKLGLEPVFKKVDNFRIIQNEITRYAIEKRILPVIIIDEANYINTKILNDLKMLFNFNMDSSDRAVVLLTGLPTLNNTLRLSIHEPLRQRITMNYHIEGLNKDEARNYIIDKLKSAKANPDVFSGSAIEAIINTSGGVPRIINKICNTALIVAHSKAVAGINNDIIMLAINEIEIGE